MKNTVENQLKFYHEQATLASEHAEKYTEQANDRSCKNPEFYRNLANKWRDEVNDLALKINRIEGKS